MRSLLFLLALGALAPLDVSAGGVNTSPAIKMAAFDTKNTVLLMLLIRTRLLTHPTPNRKGVDE